MFNYVKETIINDVANTVISTDETLVIKRGGNYNIKQICDQKIYKTVGNEGSDAVVTIDPAKFTATGVDYRQITMFVSTPNKELVEYAYPNWQEFGKPILIETSATTAAALAEAFKLALPNDNPFYKVSVSSDKVVLTFQKSWMQVDEVNIMEHKTATDTLEENKTAGIVSIVANKEEFATANWIVENLRFPSYPNLRYNALYADEAPVRGTTYVQYSFRYLVENSVPGGLSGVGQKVDSITTHVFYVPSASASAFEAKITATGYTITTTAVPAGQASKYELSLAVTTGSEG